MGKMKVYGSADEYEKKLGRVMERLGGTEVNFDWSRHGAWVEFRYKGELYRFDHTVEKAAAHGTTLKYGSDVFAQVVLALEDISRIVSRGIYDFGTWVAGMRFLPPPVEIPEPFKILGFVEMPTKEDVSARFKTLSKQYHPDAGGDASSFQSIKTAAEQALRHFA